VILISSAAYVNTEFQIEFGRLPPALLPVGNRRLFEHQIQSLLKHFPEQNIYLSLPTSYSLAPMDIVYLQRHGVCVLRSDEKLSLAASVAEAITAVGANDEELRLLHGDTWLASFPDDLNVIGIVKTNEDYQWEVEQIDIVAESVWCGYFSFQHAGAFRDALLASEGYFSHAVRLYDKNTPMTRMYIDDWHDFGHVNTYFHSRARMTTERAFNTLAIGDGCVRKMGQPAAKISAESQWFANLPAQLRLFCPQLLDHGTDPSGRPYYVLEYLPIPPLNEVFVHGKNPVFYWGKIFRLCSEFLKRCSLHAVDSDTKKQIAQESVDLAGHKTWQRLEEFIHQTGHPGLDVQHRINGTDVSSIRNIVQVCLHRLESTDPIPGLLHGDFCLSNILFDSRSDRIKVVDPRGLNASGQPSILGDLRYDIAKLTHSVIGLYDQIMAGAYEVHYESTQNLCSLTLDIHVDERIVSIQDAFLSREFVGGLKATDVLPLTVLLFFAMLPLHADDESRQTALLANALRLYASFIAERLH
jgi:fructosamine-3-kinase